MNVKNYLAILLVAILFGCSNGIENAESKTEVIEPNSAPQGQAFLKNDDGPANILNIAIGSADHSTLVAAVQAAQIENILANNGPITIFAPNNAAFDALPAGTVETLLKPENKATLAKILTYHASPGTYTGDGLKDGMKMYMATGHYLAVKRVGNDVFIGDAKILGTVDASNGVVHVIDKVLLPPDAK